jgi:hypothetical protein
MGTVSRPRIHYLQPEIAVDGDPCVFVKIIPAPNLLIIYSRMPSGWFVGFEITGHRSPEPYRVSHPKKDSLLIIEFTFHTPHTFGALA